jgi:hypothetical protein
LNSNLCKGLMLFQGIYRELLGLTAMLHEGVIPATFRLLTNSNLGIMNNRIWGSSLYNAELGKYCGEPFN